MAFCQSLQLYGTAASCEHARVLLENMPQIRRIDIRGSQLLLLLNAPVSESEYLALLAKSGVSGFSLCR